MLSVKILKVCGCAIDDVEEGTFSMRGIIDAIPRL